MTVRFARPLVAIAATLLLTMSSCTDDKPKPIPNGPTTSTPSVSTAPDAPQLSDEQKTAYDKAVDDYDEVRKVIDRLTKDPAKGVKDIEILADYTFSPALNTIGKSVINYERDGVHLEGSRKAAWQVPTKVDLKAKTPTVIWQQCNTPGDLKVFRDGKEIPQKKTNPLLSIQSNIDAKGFWHLTETKEIGTC